MNKTRPTFYYLDKECCPIRAGGAILYRFNPDLELLLIKPDNKPTLEDFGGCSDAVDTTIEDTIAREVEEESNKVFTMNEIKKLMLEGKKIYIRQCKYVVYFIDLTNTKKWNVESSKFGDKEIHDDIPRKVYWTKYTTKLAKDLCIRLKHRTVFNVLDGLVELKKMNDEIDELELKEKKSVISISATA